MRYSASKMAVGPIPKRDASVLTIDKFIASALGYFSTTCIWLDLCKTCIFIFLLVCGKVVPLLSCIKYSASESSLCKVSVD